MPRAQCISDKRAFAPSPALTVVTLLLCALFVRLGFWQWHKGVQRQQEWTRFARGAEQLLVLGARAASDVPLFQRVSVTGQLDAAHQFLLDNRTYRGSAGYEVLTPLARAGAAVLLIDRGWVPFSGSRARLPDIAFEAAAPVTLSGRIAALPSAGLASGRAAPDARAPWPKVTSYPSADELSAALGAPLAARMLLLDPQAPFGYVRDWQLPAMAPLRHFSYAIQWWSFAALALIAWTLMSTRRNHGAKTR
ncbi:MAG TPA: SURF1 family protein [Steroidobacteraceae bacterium]